MRDSNPFCRRSIPTNLEKSVDSIFRMVDYGHQSIADMVPVAMFIDGISIWLTYYVWTLCPRAGGQESSTRYNKISVDGLIPPETLGKSHDQIFEWRFLMDECFSCLPGITANLGGTGGREPGTDGYSPSPNRRSFRKCTQKSRPHEAQLRL